MLLADYLRVFHLGFPRFEQVLLIVVGLRALQCT